MLPTYPRLEVDWTDQKAEVELGSWITSISVEITWVGMELTTTGKKFP